MSQQKINDKLAKIDELIAWFNNDDFDIDEALEKFEELSKLSDEVQKDLDEVDNKINILKQKFSD